MAVSGSPVWQLYRGQGPGSLYCAGYTEDRSLVGFAPIYPCEMCNTSCKVNWLMYLNGTAPGVMQA